MSLFGSYRADAVAAALDEWRQHPEGRPDVYWRDVLPPGEAPPRDWCAAFILWAYHRAGMARGVKQYPSFGFVAPAGLKPTSTPLPGDVVYLDQPFQHHALLLSYEPTTSMVTSIDGNQPGIAPKVRFKNSNMTFYSIEPFVAAADAIPDHKADHRRMVHFFEENSETVGEGGFSGHRRN